MDEQRALTRQLSTPADAPRERVLAGVRLTRADIMRARDVAELTGLSARTIYIWARDGQIPSHRRGGVVLFLRSEIERWLCEDSFAARPHDRRT